jgi:hypothetical protein
MCNHDFVIVTFGSIQLIAGEVVDDLRDVVVCRKCGQPQPEPAPAPFDPDEPVDF